MESISQLMEHQIRESQSHLQHIDELMAKARGGKPLSLESNAQLTQFETDRDRIAQDLHDLHRQPAVSASHLRSHGTGLLGNLEAVGQEIEKTFASVFESDPR